VTLGDQDGRWGTDVVEQGGGEAAMIVGRRSFGDLGEAFDHGLVLARLEVALHGLLQLLERGDQLASGVAHHRPP
jgi:hypothetical protein